MQAITIPAPSMVQIVLLLCTVLPAAAFDLRYRKIPNWLSVSGFVAALAAHLVLGGLTGLLNSLAGFATAFALYFSLYLLHAMGAGDVKIMAAVGAITGFRWWLLLLVLTSLTGAILAFILAVYKGRLRSTLWNIAYLSRELISLRLPWLARKELDVKNPTTLRLPHGVSIAIGAILSVILMQLAHRGWPIEISAP